MALVPRRDARNATSRHQSPADSSASRRSITCSVVDYYAPESRSATYALRTSIISSLVMPHSSGTLETQHGQVFPVAELGSVACSRGALVDHGHVLDSSPAAVGFRPRLPPGPGPGHEASDELPVVCVAGVEPLVNGLRAERRQVRALGPDEPERLRDRVLAAHPIDQVPSQLAVPVQQRDRRGDLTRRRECSR